jgi:hypothetical protein
MLTYAQAEDEMRRVFLTRFNASALSVELKKRGSGNAYTPNVFFENNITTERIDNSEHFLRFYSRNLLKRQKSFTGGRNEAVGTRYTTQGLITIEIYFSKSSHEPEKANALKSVVENCFIQANANCGLWFRNPIIVDLDPDENFFRSNVLAEYEYDSVVQ